MRGCKPEYGSCSIIERRAYMKSAIVSPVKCKKNLMSFDVKTTKIRIFFVLVELLKSSDEFK